MSGGDPRHIFFYGTLMHGFPLRAGAGIDSLITFVGEGTTRGALFDLGPYPGAIKAEGQVVGELYAIAASAALLPRVDEIEGYRPADRWRSPYVREPAQITDSCGAHVSAWVYFYNGSLRRAVWVPSGDYRSHLRAARKDFVMIGGFRS